VPDLLIHSMSEFADIILPALQIAGAREIVEIGAEFGGMSQLLADHAAESGGRLTSIDPCPKAEFLDWVAGTPAVNHVAEMSLAAIPNVAGADAWVIDGDHNWYTVFHELSLVSEVCRRDGTPMLAFLHDIAWPWARRDLYYAPETIPEGHRHPHCFDSGVTLDDPGVRRARGFRGHGQFAVALREGGPKNGVLTGIEDFLEAELAEGRELGFAEIPGVFGLGVIFALDADWSAPLADHLLPLHQNRLLATLERNRLANYLHVIELQDIAAERTAVSKILPPELADLVLCS
jgi:hypothetical protein